MERETMLGKIVVKINGLALDILRPLYDLTEKLLGKDHKEWLAELKKFIRKQQCWTDVVIEPILKLISSDVSLAIGACDGKEVIAKARKTFPAGIDSDFRNWKADEPGRQTPDTPVDVYEMVRDATFSQMFGSLCADVSRLCFTQNQIVGFVEKYPEWLQADGYGTFFLFKSHDHIFVASVHVLSVGLSVNVRRFGSARVWFAGRRHRVVVPQLAG